MDDSLRQAWAVKASVKPDCLVQAIGRRHVSGVYVHMPRSLSRRNPSWIKALVPRLLDDGDRVRLSQEGLLVSDAIWPHFLKR